MLQSQHKMSVRSLSSYIIPSVVILFRLYSYHIILTCHFIYLTIMWRPHNWRSGVNIQEYSLLPEYGPGEDIIDL